jgi:hypothetical protein
MGTLGLTEAEKQSLYVAGTNQIGSQLQQAQAQSRAVGAAGMASGAGLSALQQAQFAESAAKAAAGVSQNVEVQNIQRKRELEEEIQSRIAAESQAKQEALQAGLGIASGGLLSGSQAYQDAMTMKGSKPSDLEVASFSKLLGVDPEMTRGVMEFSARSPEGKALMEAFFAGKK